MRFGTSRDGERARCAEIVKISRETLTMILKVGLPPNASIDPINVLKLIDKCITEGIDPDVFKKAYQDNMMRSLGFAPKPD